MNNGRYIQYTPTYTGLLRATFRSNNPSSVRDALISLSPNPANYIAKGSGITGEVHADVMAKQPYYICAGSGITITKVEFIPYD